MIKKELELQELLEIDRAFCLASQTLKQRAWGDYMSEEAVMVSGGHRPYVKGKKDIVAAISALYSLDDISFVWEPKIADVSDDFSMGFTTGTYTREYTYKGKHIKEIGKYTTVWKKFENSWKIVLDIGNEESVE